ncbi:MAG TPA: hypothetical protein VGR30_02385 [Candidatus Binatia bacterium]|nr:hypothetical protein [Candidatus Binatia bacterium]
MPTWEKEIVCFNLRAGPVDTSKLLDKDSAFVRWRPLIQGLVQGEDVYHNGGYPNPPLLGIVLYPLSLMPVLGGALLWFSLQVAMGIAATLWSIKLALGQVSSFLDGRSASSWF